MKTTRFERFIIEQSRNLVRNSFIPVGGFIPGEGFTRKLKEATQTGPIEDVTTMSPIPILFGGTDARWLANFPPHLMGAALNTLYNELLFDAKERQEEGKDIPNNRTITFKERNSNVTFGNVPTGIERLLNKIEKPRNIDLAATLTPDDRDQYLDDEGKPAGLHGYDLSDRHTDPDTGETFAKSYIGMTRHTAVKVINAWRQGVVAGWLGNRKKIRGNDVQWADINFGGGKPSFSLGYNGNPIKNEGGNTKMPVWPTEELLKFMPEFNEEKGFGVHTGNSSYGQVGQVTYQFKRGNDIDHKTSHVPLMLPGQLVSAPAFSQHAELLKKIKELHANDPGHKNLDGLIEEALGHAVDSEKKDSFDYLIHRYNKEPDEDGKEKYSRIYVSHKKFGGVQPLGTQKETIQGTHEDLEVIMKHFVGYKIGAGGLETVRPDGTPNNRSAVKEGVFGYMKKNTFSGTYEYYIMNSMFDEIVQEAILHIRARVGEPLYKQFVAKLKEKGGASDDAEIQALYEQVWKDIQNVSTNFATSVAQLDWGKGTRRKRRSQGIVKLQDIVGGGEGVPLQDIIDKYVTPGDVGGVGVGKQAAGERGQLRTLGRGGMLGTGAESETSMSIGHSLEVIKRMAGQKNEDPDKSLDIVNNGLEARSEIFNALVSLWVAEQIKKGNRNFSIQDAYEAVIPQFTRVLEAHGFHVSDGAYLDKDGNINKLSDLVKKAQQERLAGGKGLPKDQQKEQDGFEKDMSDLHAAAMQDTGRSGELGHRGESELEKMLKDPKVIDAISSNDPDMMNRIQALKSSLDPNDPEQKRDLERIEHALSQIKQVGVARAASPTIAAKDQGAGVVQPSARAASTRTAAKEQGAGVVQPPKTPGAPDVFDRLTDTERAFAASMADPDDESSGRDFLNSIKDDPESMKWFRATGKNFIQQQEQVSNSPVLTATLQKLEYLIQQAAIVESRKTG